MKGKGKCKDGRKMRWKDIREEGRERRNRSELREEDLQGKKEGKNVKRK